MLKVCLQVRTAHFGLRLSYPVKGLGQLLRTDCFTCKQTVKVSLCVDELLAGGDSSSLHALLQRQRSRALSWRQRELVSKFEDVERARIAVEFCSEREAHASPSTKTFNVLGGERFDVAGLPTRVVRMPGAAPKSGDGEADDEWCDAGHETPFVCDA